MAQALSHIAKQASTLVPLGGRRGIGTEACLDIIETAYSAALEPDKWGLVAERLSYWFGGPAALYVRPSRQPHTSRMIASSFDPAFEASYNDYYAARNLYVLADSHALGAVVPSEAVISPRDLERTEFYGDWLLPQRLKHGVSIQVRPGSGQALNLAMNRSAGGGEFSSSDLDHLGRLVPHLSRSLDIASKLLTLDSRAQASLAALDQLSLAAFIVSADGLVHFQNAAAERLLERTSTVRVSRGRLSASRASDQSRILQALSAAAFGKEGIRQGDIFPLSDVDATCRLSVTVAPSSDHALMSGISEPGVLVLIADSDARPGLSTEAISSVYGLTPSQARLAAALCAGESLSDYVGKAGISETTGKTHLRGIFEKLGESRQVDIVRRLLMDPALRRPR